jgi:hypothetical protein
LFGVVVILLFLVNVRRIENRRTEDVARPVIVVTLIVGGLILVTAGYSNEQIAPAFGLLGTIAGYILGRMSRPEADRALPATNPDDVAGTAPTPPGAA